MAVTDEEYEQLRQDFLAMREERDRLRDKLERLERANNLMHDAEIALNKARGILSTVI